MIATDELARVEGGVLISLGGASVIGAPPIINHGTEQQKQKWLPGLFSWKTSFCLGVTEPTGGSDVANIRTTATKTPDGEFYVVNGVKKWITGAPWATHMTTAVRTGGPGRNQISVLVQQPSRIPICPSLTINQSRQPGECSTPVLLSPAQVGARLKSPHWLHRRCWSQTSQWRMNDAIDRG